MHDLTRRFRDFIVSLQLTVALLILSLILVFAATLDQVNLGIWAVQEKYFRSFFVMWHAPNSGVVLPIFPGGYLIGGFLLTNLLAAHIYRFQLTWKKMGIQLAHAGLILLLLGELVTGLMQMDSSMQLEEGQTKSYSESFREHELALIDKTDPAFDEVVAVPEAALADEGTVQHPKLPFSVRVKAYYANATLQMGDPAGRPGTPVATQGIGSRVQVLPLPLTYKPDENNQPAAFIEIGTTEGTLGTWAVSPLVGMPQTFAYQGRTWELALRLRRHYAPFSLTLLQVTHEKYPGTEIPKNFASRVRLKDEAGREDREVVIFMNNPLRHGGLTFYQYQMNAAGRMSAFQVVSNPGWLMPYIACILMGAGLSLQFCLSLAGFIRKRSAAQVG
ncbi:MAG: cytochrome c biogenesis protein ResB [Opitutae bacterium]|nr:cytochrome c biogenesis protein ResB [Opitutae bacterium]